jgi:hypothetical protein
MKANLTCTVIVTALVCLMAAGLVGCGGKKSSARTDAMELERAFGLVPGVAPSEEPTPAGLASRAVAAIRAQDWPKAVSVLGQLRKVRDLTSEQMQAVHNAQGNANVRLVELAAKGNAEAKAALDRSKREAESR